MTHRLIRTIIFIFGTAAILCAQSNLHRKNDLRPGLRRLQGTALEGQPVRRRQLGWSHVVVEKGEQTPADYLQQVEERGGRIVRYVPDSGYVLNIPGGMDLSDLGFSSAEEIDPAGKISSTIDVPDGEVGFFLVEFHPDVTVEDAESIVAQSGFILHANPDLLAEHFLVEGPVQNLASIAAWDEVAYIFEASPEIVQGTPVSACTGALTSSGTVGQYIATVGEGWDGPGKGGADLTYSFAALTTKLSHEAVVAQIQRVFAEWSKAAKITFTYTDRLDGPRNLNILFAAGNHGDGYPFDGPGKVLAHTFYPAPPNTEPIAGDLHFDADENWNAGVDIDVFSVVLHEMGHALGLGHSDRPGAVMYPYYQRVSRLSPADITAIQTLYAAPGAIPSPSELLLTVQAPASSSLAVIDISGTSSGGTGEVRVTWSSDHGQQGVADGVRTWTIHGASLSPGANTFHITATDAQNVTATKSVVITRVPQGQITVSISSPPAGAVTEPLVTLTGSASSSAGVTVVRWVNSRGGSGEATGTTNWSARVPLLAGQNDLTVMALTASGLHASATLTVTYASMDVDRTPPSVSIASPAARVVATASATIRIIGTASDNVGVTQVDWSASTGSSGAAAGTSQWDTGVIPLLVGDNLITIRAKDAAGNIGWRTVMVSRH